MGIIKTAVGIMAGVGAVKSFGLGRHLDEPREKLASVVAGSILAATSYHILKDEVGDVKEVLKKLIR